ncbi:unnamed protein product [Durusdinium trenchii]|uniref:Uncharacterized protein n=1 Tax=Durusdinium trenchii TaxID=1381693 RepID=A0ABP0HX39_9DINO
MEQSLVAILTSLELQVFQPSLERLGVASCEDIAVLQDGDLLQAGLSLVQTRKLQKRAKETVPSSEPDGQVDEPSRKRRSPHEETTEPTASRARCGSFRAVLSTGKGPRRLIFIRHGESEGNVNRKLTATVPDHNLHLTERGRQQAIEAGVKLKALLGDGSLRCICSPYVRARETLNGVLRAWGSQPWPCQEDVRLREQEFGNYDAPDIKEKHKEKARFGAFYYRFTDGESLADCYDRAWSFLESLRRSFQAETAENLLVVGHGNMLVVLLMCLFQIKVSEFASIRPLENGEFAVCERAEEMCYTWPSVELRREGPEAVEIWDGDPASRLLSHESADDSA